MSTKEKVIELHEEGLNVSEIARKLGIARQSVSYHLRLVDRKSSKQRKLHNRFCQRCGIQLTEDRWFNCVVCAYEIGTDPQIEEEHRVNCSI